MTLAIAVALLTFSASLLQFATRSHVLAGTVVDERLQIDFTLDADRSHTYEVNPALAQFLKDHVSFSTKDPARVLSAEVEITSKDVSWTESRHTVTFPGGAIAAQLRWSTPPDSPDGTHGAIYLDFPPLPGLPGAITSFHSGRYQKDDEGRYVVREITTYRSPVVVALARFLFALSVGLPFGILLHAIYWIFVVIGEKRTRLAALPPRGPALPQTFYPNPIAEWSAWLLTLSIGTLVACVLASIGLLDGFISSFMTYFIYVTLALAVAVALAFAYFSGKFLLTITVGADGISYARGRGNLQWLTAGTSDIGRVTEKHRTYRGSTTHWIEIVFNDHRKKLKIRQSIEGYSALRDLVVSLFHR